MPFTSRALLLSHWASILLVVGIEFTCASAKAVGPFDVEAGAKFGAASNPVGGGFPNPLGLGIGGRAGVAAWGAYGGISAMYYGGTSGQFETRAPPYSILADRGSVSAHSVLYGIELGYGLRLLRRIVLRGQVGLGNDVLGASGTAASCLADARILCSHTVSGSTQYLYVEPGITALAEFGTLYVGVDAEVLVLPSGPSVNPTGMFSSDTSPFSSDRVLGAALSLDAHVGVRF
jgi:hypothetical protein